MDMQYTRKKMGKYVLGMICQFLDWLDDADVRDMYPEATKLWHRATRFEYVVDMSMPNNVEIWRVNGKKHRSGDLPAVIVSDRRIIWYKNDQIHRDGDLPAVIHINGVWGWFMRDTERTNMSAYGNLPVDFWFAEYGEPPELEPDGYTLEWWQDNNRYRHGDRPTIVYSNGRLEWYDCILEDGYLIDVLHRENGPAVIRTDGMREYWRYGTRCENLDYYSGISDMFD